MIAIDGCHCLLLWIGHIAFCTTHTHIYITNTHISTECMCASTILLWKLLYWDQRCEKEKEKTKREIDDRGKSTAHVRCRKREYIKINLTSGLIKTHIELNEEKIDYHTYTTHTQTWHSFVKRFWLYKLVNEKRTTTTTTTAIKTIVNRLSESDQSSISYIEMMCEIANK